MREFLETENLSAIEIAKSLMNLKGITKSKQDFEAIKKLIIKEENTDRTNQIIKGLEQEDEFAVLCKLMETCESISKVGQSPIINNGEIAPDFIASFKPGCSVTGLSKDKIGITYNCFLEVKSCKDKKFKISEKDLKARKKYAERFGLPLVFAIRFSMFGGQCFWILIEANHLENKGRKVEVTDLIESLSSVLFDDYCLMTHPNLHFVHYYSNTAGLEGIKHPKYGVLQKTAFILPGQEPFEIKDNFNGLVNFVIGTYEVKEIEIKSDGSLTTVLYNIGDQIRLLSDMLYRANNLVIDNDKQLIYDATKIITRMDSKINKTFLITRKAIEYAISYLNSKELLLFKIAIREPKEQETILHSLLKTN